MKKLCLQVELFFPSFTVTDIELKKKPKLMEHQFLLNGKTLSKPRAVLGNTCLPFVNHFSRARVIEDMFHIQFSQIKEQTKAREIAEDM